MVRTRSTGVPAPTTCRRLITTHSSRVATQASAPSHGPTVPGRICRRSTGAARPSHSDLESVLTPGAGAAPRRGPRAVVTGPHQPGDVDGVLRPRDPAVMWDFASEVAPQRDVLLDDRYAMGIGREVIEQPRDQSQTVAYAGCGHAKPVVLGSEGEVLPGMRSAPYRCPAPSSAASPRVWSPPDRAPSWGCSGRRIEAADPDGG